MADRFIQRVKLLIGQSSKPSKLLASDVTYLVFFAFVVGFVLSGILFDDRLIGRFLDFPVPYIDSLQVNAYKSSFFTWWGAVNGGVRNTFGVTLIPVNSLLYFPLLFGANAWFTARFLLVLPLYCAMAFSFLFFKRLLVSLGLSRVDQRLVAFLGSLFFTLNNYFFCEVIYGSSVMYTTFAFSPLVLYLLLKYFDTSKRLYLYLLFLNLLIVCSSIQRTVFIFFLLFFFCLIYRRVALFLTISLFYLLSSMYWILPAVYTVKDIAATELAGDYTSGLVNSASEFVRAFVNSDYFGNRNLYNIALHSSKLSLVWFINAFTLISVSFFAVYKSTIFEKRTKKLVIFFFAVFLAAVWFSKGGKPPLGELVVLLYKLVPVFKIYKSLQHYLSFYVVAISSLFVLSAGLLVFRRRVFLLIFACMVTINALPWFINRDMGTKNIAMLTSYPPFGLFYLSEGNRQMYALQDQPGDFSVFYIPPGLSVFYEPSELNDVRTQGGDSALYFGNKGFFAVESANGFMKTLLRDLEKAAYLDDDFFNKYRSVLSLLNVKYVVFREDTTPNFSKNLVSYNFDTIKTGLQKTADFKEIYHNDAITIIETDTYLPLIHSPERVVTVDGFGDIPLDTLASNAVGGSAVISSLKVGAQESVEVSRWLAHAGSSVNNDMKQTSAKAVDFEKINPTKYKLHVRFYQDEVPLVFLQSFQPGWRVYPKKTGGAVSEWLANFNFLQKPVSDDTHTVIDGYANGWLLSKKEICGALGSCRVGTDGVAEVDLSLEFFSQRVFISCLIFDGMLILILLSLLVREVAVEIRLRKDR